MSLLDKLLILSALTVVLALFMGQRKMAGWLVTVVYAGQLAALWMMSGLGNGQLEMIHSSLEFTIWQFHLHWQFDALSWFFALITVASAMLASWFSAGGWSRHYHQQGRSIRLFNVALALNVLGMLILLASGELLSLFIGWELVSWASFLLMALGSFRYAMRYLLYAIAGAMAMLAAMVMVYLEAGSLEFRQIAEAVAGLDNTMVWWVGGLFMVGFGIKMALLPFHLWQAKAYAVTPGPGAAFLGAISSRMGLFAIVLVLVKLIGIGRLLEMPISFTFLNARDLLAWVSIFTIILPTLTALRQHDARYLLAWHGIGQGGYMLLGIVVASDLGSAGGLLHVFNYATNQAVLFMAVTAVVYRTGTSDLNKLGGLFTRMPLSFLAMLIGIIGLAGLPPMNGFVSKWLIYRALIIDGSPLLFLGTVIGTLGTILSVYKLIHNTFLGQLRLEHEKVEEAPLSMILPMMLLSIVIFMTGFFPGLVLGWVASVQSAVGLPVLAYHAGGVDTANGGLDMIWVVSVLLAGFAIATLIFFSGGRSRRVHQLDNYAGGHFLTADTRYQYSDNFYPGLMHLIGPWYRNSFRQLEQGLVSLMEFVSTAASGLYRHGHPSVYLLALVVVALFTVVM
jgi:NADH-quinone oxidoreductase subunit M